MAIHLGYDSCDGASVSSDDQSLAPLHIVEQSGQMSFGFGSLNFAHETRLTMVVQISPAVLNKASYRSFTVAAQTDYR